MLALGLLFPLSSCSSAGDDPARYGYFYSAVVTDISYDLMDFYDINICFMTLKAVSSTLSDEYCIFNISFETVEDACFKDENHLYAKFISLLARSFMWTPLSGLDSVVAEMIVDYSKDHKTECSSDDFEFFISSICHQNSKPIVLVVDEVDHAGNYPSFLKFLGLLRGMYLNKDVIPTFQSVILAGVYDIKKLF